MAENTNSAMMPKMNISLRKLSVNAQTKLFTLGVALPAALLWLGTYVMFTLPALLSQIEAYLANFGADKTPSIYKDLLLPLNANSGLDYYVIGIAMYIIALILARAVANRFHLTELKLGEIRLRSLLMATLISVMVAAVVISLANRALFDPLLALQSAA